MGRQKGVRRWMIEGTMMEVAVGEIWEMREEMVRQWRGR
jgi:hypothetical protein